MVLKRRGDCSLVLARVYGGEREKRRREDKKRKRRRKKEEEKKKKIQVWNLYGFGLETICVWNCLEISYVMFGTFVWKPYCMDYVWKSLYV